MKMLKTAAMAFATLAIVLAFSQADAAGKAGGKKDDAPAGWDQGTKKGWEGDQPPGKDKADAEVKKAKGEASAQKKKAEGDAQKAKEETVKKADKTVKGQQAGAKAKGSAAVEKAVEKPVQ